MIGQEGNVRHVTPEGENIQIMGWEERTCGEEVAITGKKKERGPTIDTQKEKKLGLLASLKLAREGGGGGNAEGNLDEAGRTKKGRHRSNT